MANFDLTNTGAVVQGVMDDVAGQTDGTASASKVPILDANKDIFGKRFDINRSLRDVIADGPAYRYDEAEHVTIDTTSIPNIYPYSMECVFRTLAAVVYALVFVGDKDQGDRYQALKIDSSGLLQVVTRNAGADVTGTGTTAFNDGLPHHAMAVFTDATDREVYGDGKSEATETTSATIAAVNDRLSIGRMADVTPQDLLSGEVSMTRIWNRALTATEVLDLASGMPVPYADVGASVATINTGSLTIGKRYRITAQDGENFVADGAADNNVGTEFIATGTSVTLDANDTVVRIGCVIQYEQDGISPTTWYDKSGNGLDGVVSSAIAINMPIAYVNDVGNHMVEGAASTRCILRSIRLKIEPGATPGTNMNVTEQAAATGFNQPTITDATNLAATGSSGSFALSTDGKTLTMAITETVVGLISTDIIVHDVDNSSTTIIHFMPVTITAGNIEWNISKAGAIPSLSFLTMLQAADRMDITIAFVTST